MNRQAEIFFLKGSILHFFETRGRRWIETVWEAKATKKFWNKIKCNLPQNKKEIERKKVSKDLTKVYFFKRKKIGNGKVFYLAGYLQQFEEKLFLFLSPQFQIWNLFGSHRWVKKQTRTWKVARKNTGIRSGNVLFRPCKGSYRGCAVVKHAPWYHEVEGSKPGRHWAYFSFIISSLTFNQGGASPCMIFS